MSRAIDSDIITQIERTMATAEEEQAILDDFDVMPDLIRDHTRSQAERYQVGAYLVGRPGSSKTCTAMETLERLETPWAYRNSQMRPIGLYCLLEGHIVVLDDISTLFHQPQALQILMAALGGKAGRPRTITYETKDERKHFECAGGIIAISHLPLGRDPLADAEASRVVMLEHEPSDGMIAAFMRSKALKGFEEMTPEECLEVVEFVAGLPAGPARQGAAALAGIGAIEPEAARGRRAAQARGAGRTDRLGAAGRRGVVRSPP